MYGIMVACVMIMLRRGTITLVHPLLFATLTYYLPASLGALKLSVSKPQLIYASLLPDYNQSLIRAMALSLLGYACLWLGCNVSDTMGVRVRIRRLRDRVWTARSVIVPALILVIVGDICRLEALNVGAIGYSDSVTGAYGDTFFYLGIMAMMGMCLLCWIIFRHSRGIVIRALATIGVAAHCVFVVVTSGGKGGAVSLYLLIMLSFYATGRHMKRRGLVLASVAALVCIVGGTIYGTEFRHLMRREHQASLSEYQGLSAGALAQVSTEEMATSLGNGLQGALDRLDQMSSLAVIIERHKELRDAEAVYGIKNNIVNDTVTSIIPRFVWQEKPLVSDARSLTLLYFDVRGNSLAISFVGDLLRNGGIVGVCIGMIVLGAALTYGYIRLVVRTSSEWARVTYCVLLWSINFEGFYSVIFPTLVRCGVVCIIAGLFVNWFAPQMRGMGAGTIGVAVQRRQARSSATLT